MTSSSERATSPGDRQHADAECLSRHHFQIGQLNDGRTLARAIWFCVPTTAERDRDSSFRVAAATSILRRAPARSRSFTTLADPRPPNTRIQRLTSCPVRARGGGVLVQQPSQLTAYMLVNTASDLAGRPHRTIGGTLRAGHELQRITCELHRIAHGTSDVHRTVRRPGSARSATPSAIEPPRRDRRRCSAASGAPAIVRNLNLTDVNDHRHRSSAILGVARRATNAGTISNVIRSAATSAAARRLERDRRRPGRTKQGRHRRTPARPPLSASEIPIPRPPRISRAGWSAPISGPSRIVGERQRERRRIQHGRRAGGPERLQPRRGIDHIVVRERQRHRR